jgi:uncharacterized protein (TIGR03435 family)
MNRLALACAFAVAAFAQNQRLAYDVATIKLNTSGDGMMRIGGLGPGPGGGHFRVTNLPLRQLIILAYADRSQGPPAPGGGPGVAITGGPSWINTDRYDIEARPEQGFIPTVEQAQKMLQALLEERFGLQVRHETKDGPIYALTVAKGGLKAKKSADQTPLNFGAPTPGGPAGGPPPPPPAPFNPGGPMPRGMMMVGIGQLRATAQTMSGFAGLLTGSAGRKVVDRTSLEGLYDFELNWTPDQIPANLPADAPFPRPDPNGPSIFTALQEQLGLKLESATGPLESIVIESVHKPTEN